jgi:hypothetical protein
MKQSSIAGLMQSQFPQGKAHESAIARLPERTDLRAQSIENQWVKGKGGHIL